MRLLLTWIMIGASLLGAQDITLVKQGQVYPVRDAGNGIYAVMFEGQPFLIIAQSTVDSLLKKIEQLTAENNRHRRVLAAQDSLLKAYQNFELHARQQVQLQKQLIATADSLYMGYQQLYQRARQLVGYGKYALWGQVTIAHWGEPPATRPLGSLGIGFENWIVGYQFGQQFQGITIGIRWPVGW